MDYSPPGSSVHGNLQARILDWVAMPSSRGSFQPRGWTWVSYVSGSLPLAPPGEPPNYLYILTVTLLHRHRGTYKWKMFGKKYRCLDWGGVCDGRTGALHRASSRGRLLVSFHFLEHRCSPVLQDHLADRRKRIKFWMNPNFHFLITSWGFLFSAQFSCVDSLRPHGLQHTRLPCLTNSQSLLKLMSIESVMSSNHLILYSFTNYWHNHNCVMIQVLCEWRSHHWTHVLTVKKKISLTLYYLTC